MTEYCYDCGKECVPDGVGTGYGTDREGHHVCYECCGKRDAKQLEEMKVGECVCMYLAKRDCEWYVTNWPGTLRFHVFPREGRHNFAGKRYDVWFSHKGREFHGVRYGNDSEICHVRRVKDAA